MSRPSAPTRAVPRPHGPAGGGPRRRRAAGDRDRPDQPVRSSRSTVGTMTELNDHLKLLYARAAQLFDRETAQLASARSRSGRWRPDRRDSRAGRSPPHRRAARRRQSRAVPRSAASTTSGPWPGRAARLLPEAPRRWLQVGRAGSSARGRGRKLHSTGRRGATRHRRRVRRHAAREAAERRRAGAPCFLGRDLRALLAVLGYVGRRAPQEGAPAC